MVARAMPLSSSSCVEGGVESPDIEYREEEGCRK